MIRMNNPATYTNSILGAKSICIANTGGGDSGVAVALAARALEAKLPSFVIIKEAAGRIPPHQYIRHDFPYF